ncbi:DUF3618 domain-containing protein [Falsiroseomonas sp.]|uniref:DUF3618 domain-containing protein n=1 Tax=Falsiroseomonas sp. TaxID=2870721 RepID=UPI003F7000E4
MSGTDPGNRGSAEIEHEVEATRAGLTQTLEELRDRTSPGQLFEQALDYARTSGGAEFTRNLGTAVRDNPLPLLLIGAGIGWLMLGKAPGVTTPRLRSGAYPAGRQSGAYAAPGSYAVTDRDFRGDAESGPGMLSQAAEAVGDAAGAVRDSVTGAARSAADAAGSAYRSVAGAVGSAGETAGQAAHDLRGRGERAAHAAADYAGQARHEAADYADRAYCTAGDYAGAAQDRMGEWVEEAQHSMGSLLRDQPLVLGALGVALGAAVGAMLPRTEAEDRLMGETRDDLAQQAAEMAQQGYAAARDSIGDQAGQARGTATEGVSTMAGQAREAVVGAAHGLAERAKAALAEAPEGEAAKPETGAASQPGGGVHPGMRPAGGLG